MRTIEIPGSGLLQLDHLVLDLNGTLTFRGKLIPGVSTRLQRLATDLELHLVTADTFGTAGALGSRLGLSMTTIATGADKAAFVTALGGEVTAAIGNGRNDAAMLRAARLGIAVIGPEGASSAAAGAADIICSSVTRALDLLLEERLLIATLRP
jgi:P-type E1-E2 ATPase